MCPIRVPNARGQATRIENRMSGSDNNPYLTMAAMYVAGLDGIRNRTSLPDPIRGEDAYSAVGCDFLPSFLDGALDALQADEVLVRYLGQNLVNTYVALKKNEINRFSNHVTDWEMTEHAELF